MDTGVTTELMEKAVLPLKEKKVSSFYGGLPVMVGIGAENLRNDDGSHNPVGNCGRDTVNICRRPPRRQIGRPCPGMCPQRRHRHRGGLFRDPGHPWGRYGA